MTTITTMTPEEIQAKLKEARAKAKTKVEQRAETFKAQIELNRLTSDEYLDRQARAAIVEEGITTIAGINDIATEVVDGNPQMSVTTGTQYVFEARPVLYGIGLGMERLLATLTAIRYTHREHKMEILQRTGINEVYMDMFLAAMGNTAYFSKTSGIMVEEKPFNFEDAMTYLSMLEENLGIELDKSLFTEATMAQLFETARERAKNTQSDFLKGLQKKESEMTHELLTSLAEDEVNVA